jgi:hypothetical protein
LLSGNSLFHQKSHVKTNVIINKNREDEVNGVTIPNNIERDWDKDKVRDGTGLTRNFQNTGIP